VIRKDPPLSAEPPQAGATPEGWHGGDVDGSARMETGAPMGRPRYRLQERSRWPWWLGGIAMASMLLVLLYRQPIADHFWPETRAQVLQSAAEQALARNHLTAADGSGARELYEAALAIDPDRAEAQTGLARVAAAALVQAVAALSRNDFEAAHQHLRLARALSVPKAHGDTVADALRRREAAHGGVDQLLARAETAREQGDEHAALPLYRRVLTLQPDRIEALRGREDALTDLLENARGALRRGDLGEAAVLIATAREHDRGHVDLPETEARLTEEIEAVRRRADANLGRGRLQEAATAYRSLLALSPEDAAAARGLSRVATAHATRVERLAADFNIAAAETELAAARALAPDASEVREAARHLQRARQSRARLAGPAPTAARAARIRVLLEEAAAAEARGDLLSPPGDSAFDKLRAARALAPDAPAVRQASARLLPAATACFERELRGNNLARAGACLDARGVLSDDDAALRDARQRLAQRWLAVGDERLAAGELQSAAAALAAARGSDPSLPGIPVLADRLRTAGVPGQ
jgi:tetratricopeptide (TPR) repeat protein